MLHGTGIVYLHEWLKIIAFKKVISMNELTDDTVDGSEIRDSPVEVGRLSVYLIVYKVLYI